jgi:hypothetical protein
VVNVKMSPRARFKPARALILLVPAACFLLAAGAGAYDRKPITIDQAQVDGAGQTISNAEKSVRSRYPKALGVRCTGALIRGHESDSYWVAGTARYWDKLYCTLGTSSRTTGLSLIFDPKGKGNTFLIYRVKPWKDPNAPSTPAPTPTRPPAKPAGGSGSVAGSVGRIKAGFFFRITSATVNADRSVTVNWKLPADTDSDAYANLQWTIDGHVGFTYNESNWRRTQLTTRPLSSGPHTVEVVIANVFWTNRYYSTADCDVSSRDAYVWICSWDDTSSVSVTVR